MNFTEFMSILNGEYKETAGTDAKNQCVDLANAYIKYVLGLPIIEWTNAVDFPVKAGDKYEWIPNTPTGVPQEGDLVIWGGTYGHIAIFIEGDAKRFTSFDENYPTGSPCHVQEHTYLSPKVLGWLHPKVVLSDLQTQLDQTRSDRDRNWNWYIQLCDILGVGSNIDVATAEAKKLTSIEDLYNQKDKQLQEVQTKNEDLTKKLTDISFTHTELINENVELKNKVASYEDKINEQGIQITQALSDLDELKKQTNKPVLKGWKLKVFNWLIKA